MTKMSYSLGNGLVLIFTPPKETTMSDLSKIMIREQNKLDRQDEAVRVTRAHIKALEQLELELVNTEVEVKLSPKK